MLKSECLFSYALATAYKSTVDENIKNMCVLLVTLPFLDVRHIGNVG